MCGNCAGRCSITSSRRERSAGPFGRRERTQNHLNFLHGVFGFALKRGWVSSNPVALVDRPKKNRSRRRRIRFLQPTELDELIAAVPDDTLDAVERPLYVGAALTGLRQGELLALAGATSTGLRAGFGWPTASAAASSTRRSRTRAAPSRWPIVWPGKLERHFQRSAYRGDDDLVFCHPETRHVLDPSKVRKRFKRAVDRAGVPEITFHELRHTFGTQMAATGAPLRAIQGGWATPTRRPPRSIGTTRLTGPTAPRWLSALSEAGQMRRARGSKTGPIRRLDKAIRRTSCSLGRPTAWILSRRSANLDELILCQNRLQIDLFALRSAEVFSGRMVVVQAVASRSIRDHFRKPCKWPIFGLRRGNPRVFNPKVEIQISGLRARNDLHVPLSEGPRGL
jgi:integrase